MTKNSLRASRPEPARLLVLGVWGDERRALASGGTASVTIVVQVTAPYGNLSNTATATSSTPDPNPDDNHSTAVATVGSGIPMLSPPLVGLLALLLAAAGLWFVHRD